VRRRGGFAIHSWLGVMAGLLMFVICWSGTVATVSHEIDWLLNPMLRVEPAGTSVSWGELHNAIRAEYPDAGAIELQAPLYRRFAAVAIIETPQQQNMRVYLDPYRGTVLGHTSFFNVQRFFRSLHMALFDPFGKMLGYWLVSLFGFLLLGLAITPLVFYRRWWRGLVTTPVRGQARRAWWSNFHKLSGAWSLGFALLMGVTGAWWTFEYGGVDLGYPERPEPAIATGEPVRLDLAIAAVANAWPSLDVRSLYVPPPGHAEPLLVNGQAEAWLVRDRANWLQVDPRSGAVLAQQRATSLAWPARWIDTVDPLHFGDFGGLALKLAWCVFGLLLSAMALSGAYLHYERLDPAHGGVRHRGRGFAAAAGAAAIVLVLTAVGGWTEIRSYGPVDESGLRWPQVEIPVVAFLAAWILVTLGTLIAWSSKLYRRSSRL
jgi:uncharacterized iron-regulated membrane protein